ncbi:MAG: LysR family transcriptional regulator [gamma proteobacterium symbiont of Bathyaustriella thionipta]|nr:LysR family transcriptional regulator [gamma proteobacterium symbiont of Bathyaustriella thionipta]
MNMDQIKAFREVARCQSFSVASLNLHLSQPAVSKRIAKLESDLQQPLFDRIGHQIQLTEAGKRLYRHSEDLLRHIENIVADLDQLHHQVSGTLSMAISHHVGLHRIPQSLRSFIAKYPAVHLDIRFMGSEAAATAVEHGELELAVVTLPENHSSRLLLKPLWNDPLHFVVSREQKSSALSSLQQLSSLPAVLPESGTVTRQIIENVFHAHQLKINIRLASDNLESLKMLVQAGLGWSVLPATLLDESLLPIKIADIQLQRHLGLVSHKDRTPSNAALAMMAMLRTSADCKQDIED